MTRRDGSGCDPLLWPGRAVCRGGKSGGKSDAHTPDTRWSISAPKIWPASGWSTMLIARFVEGGDQLLEFGTLFSTFDLAHVSIVENREKGMSISFDELQRDIIGEIDVHNIRSVDFHVTDGI
jgi:hypothetical protein